MLAGLNLRCIRLRLQWGRLIVIEPETLGFGFRFRRQLRDGSGPSDLVPRNGEIAGCLADTAPVAAALSDVAARNLRILRGFRLSPSDDLRPRRNQLGTLYRVDLSAMTVFGDLNEMCRFVRAAAVPSGCS